MKTRSRLAKISRPRLFNVVARERLFALLDANRGRPMVWIAAPPGSGKTALVASYLEARTVPCLWFQIDAGDADPGSFFLHLSLGADSLSEGEQTPLPRFAPEHHADLAAFARLYFRALFSRMSSDSVLVFDNYQDAGNDVPLHDLLCQAAAEIPTGCSIVVLSRVEAPQQFVRLRANGALLSLGWNELQLTLDEVRAICAGRQCKDEWLLQALLHQSQGWVAGLTLMLERLGHFDGETKALPSDTRESVFHYFAEMIFDQVPPRVRETLLSLAFVRSVTPRIACELSGDADAPALLEDLYRRRMFTERRQDDEPVYQFHALFREFLDSRVRRDYALAALVALMCRSAAILEASGDLDAAMDLWVATADWERAISLVQREAPALLNCGRRRTVLQWIAYIPESLRQRSPWLLYWRGVAQYQGEPETGLEALQQALACFRERGDQRGRMICLTSLLSYGMVGYAVIHSVNPWLDELLELYESCTDELSVNDRLRINGVLCVALYYFGSSCLSTREMAQRTEELLPQSTNLTAKLESAMGAITTCAQSGDFERGERILHATRSCADDPSASPSLAAWWYAQAGYLRFNSGRIEDGLEFFRLGCNIAERNGLRESMRELIMFCVMVEFRLFGWEVANETLARVERMPPSKRPMAEALLRIYQARKAQANGLLDRGADLARESHQAVLRTRSHHVEMCFGLFNAEIMIAAGRFAESRPLLERSRALIEDAALYDYFAAALDFVEALAALMLGDRALAIALTRKSLALSRVGNSRFSFRYLECSMPPIFKLALEEGIETELVQELIQLFRLKPPPDAPDNWPWPVTVRTLGGFSITVDGQPVKFSRKLPRKALLLLKALIACGVREIPEHTLCDLLWGDEDGDAAQNALSITLSRLRKLLGKPETILHQGSKLSLNPAMCRVDAWTFEAKLAQGDQRKALDLYAGSFLPEDAGEHWSVAMRERLRGKFIHALSSHGAAMEVEGDFDGAAGCYLRGIDADPIVEAFYQGLMRCYRALKRPTEAISAYRRMRQTLTVVLGVTPSVQSQRLYDELMRDGIGAGGSNVELLDTALGKVVRNKP